MRQIKFRVWDGTRIIPIACEKNDTSIVFSEDYWEAVDTFRGIPILLCKSTDPNVSLMQYTGVNDKNGVEIYEGDIVEEISISYDLTKEGYPEIENKRISTVEYSCHGFWIKDEFFGWEGEGLWDWNNLKVIGNIYENPELLEKQ